MAFNSFPIPTITITALGLGISIKDPFFGAVGDGVTNDTNAFLAFNTWAKAQNQSIILTIPPGNYLINDHTSWVQGVKELVIWAYGATVSWIAIEANAGFDQNNSHTALINSTAQGDSSVTLVNLSDASNFSVGDWIAIGSLELQLDHGFPPNFFNIEYKRIASISGTTIGLDGGYYAYDSHIRYVHLSTYPDMANIGSPWAGGAARIFKMMPDWDIHLKIFGLIINYTNVSQGVYFKCRKLELIDVNIQNPQSPNGIAPQQARDILYERCTIPWIEVDKCIETLTLRNCQIQALTIQSASTTNIIFDGCHISSGLGGTTTRNFVARNSTMGNINFFGEFGRAETVTLDNCYIAGYQENVLNNFIDLSALTFAAGAFSLLKSSPENQQFAQFAVPGAAGYFVGNVDDNMGNPFIITNVREDSTKYYMDTTLRALPSYSGTGSPVASRIVMHPGTNVNVTSCTGAENIQDLSGAPKGFPVHSYGHRLGFLVNSSFSVGTNCWGYITKIRVNVRRAYTGATGPTPFPMQWQMAYYLNNVRTFIIDFFDIRVAGERVYLPGSSTGAVGTDTMSTIPVGAWLSSSQAGTNFSADYSVAETQDKWPLIEIETFTDQWPTNYGSTRSLQQILW